MKLSQKYKLDSIIKNGDNVAKILSKEDRNKIAQMIKEDFDYDEESRSEWLDRSKAWMKLAEQVWDHKNYPWPNASNVKYPLLTTASVQFHARAFPNLVKGEKPVFVRPVGKSSDEKTARADRVSTYMSHQILYQMREWIDDMDRLLFVLPVLGICHKKTYYSVLDRRPKSELIFPQDLSYNYFAKDYLNTRKTHILHLSRNEVVENVRRGLYLDVLDKLSLPTFDESFTEARDDAMKTSPNYPEKDLPYKTLETHGWLDLDGDGYEEPYIITVEYDSVLLFRITPRFFQESVELNSRNQVVKIDPINMFTSFLFLPEPNSKVYGMGFGNLIGPMNRAINTIINQLIDAGHLATIQGGFLGKGVRVKGGAVRFRPGEWKNVMTTGDDLRKGIVPLPVKEPSATLFNLLGFMTEAGERLSSVSDIMAGRNPGQNQPYSTSVQVLEQGMKVFVGIYKRIFRSLTEEYRKLYMVDRLFGNQQDYTLVLDEQANMAQDFDVLGQDIMPMADPDLMTDAQKLLRSESLLVKMQAGMPLNMEEVTRRSLEAEGHEDIQKLMDVQPPGPSFEQQIEMKKLELQEMEQNRQYELDVIRVQNEALKDNAQAVKSLASAQSEVEDSKTNRGKLQVDAAKVAVDARKANGSKRASD